MIKEFVGKRKEMGVIDDWFGEEEEKKELNPALIEEREKEDFREMIDLSAESEDFNLSIALRAIADALDDERKDNEQYLEDSINDNIERSIINTYEFVIKELDKIVGYYEQPQDQFEMGFRQGIYRAKMKVEELLKRYKE